MRKVEDYEIVREIGRGAFGQVFLAHKDGKDYAIKETLSSGRKAVKTAQAESELMVKLDHTNIVKLYEYFTVGRPAKCYMVMELLVGRELVSLICDENLTEDLTEDILKMFVRQITQGLAYIHDKDIVHLDMKPENLIAVEANGQYTQAKIVDFGMAKSTDGRSDVCTLDGTDGYKSPEQINYEPISGQTDMWALGCITYELMSGFLAFDFETPMEYAKKVLSMDWSMEFDFDEDDEDDENPFDFITDDGKDFLTQLIKSKPSERMDAKSALNHSWLQNTDASQTNLNSARKNLKRIQARRRWRNAIYVILATCRMNPAGRMRRKNSEHFYQSM